MAIAITALTNGDGSDSTVSSNDAVTGSLDPTDGATVYAFICNGKGASPAASVSTVTGACITGMARVGSSKQFNPVASSTFRLELWKGIATASSGAATILLDGTATGCVWKFFEASGDSGSVVQSLGNSADTSASVTCGLSAFADAGNATLIGAAANGTTHTITNAQGFTEIGSKVRMSDDSPTMILSAFWLASEEDNPALTISSTRNWGAFSAELALAGGGGGGGIVEIPMGVLL